MPLAIALRSFTRPPWPLMFCVATLGLILSQVGATPTALPTVCSTTGQALLTSGFSDLVALTLLFTSPLRLAADWAIMLLAMMPPLLVMPLMHVWRSSMPRRRMRAVGGFVLGYASLWMAAGPVLIGLSLMLSLLAVSAAITAALLLAAVWNASPWQREALNRSHRLSRIGLFGWAADRDAVRFGARHALWCIVSCWPWMLVPLVAGQWHIPAMILSGAVILAERLAPPDRPRWHWPAIVSLLGRSLVPMSRKGAPGHG